ncbi:MAG: hypothetical protein ACREOK_00870 [Gemmatimonadaceae bacterium]
MSIHFGHYLSHPIKIPLARPPLIGRKVVEVIRAEEKGSDASQFPDELIVRDRVGTFRKPSGW